MKDSSIFEGVVYFEAEGFTYQAIWKGSKWEMAAIDGDTVLEMLDVESPYDSTPGTLLKAWWAAQKKVGTYSVAGFAYSD